MGDLVRTGVSGEVKVVEQPEDHTIHDIVLPLPGYKVSHKHLLGFGSVRIQIDLPISVSNYLFRFSPD